MCRRLFIFSESDDNIFCARAEIFKSLKYTLPDQAEEKPAVKPPSMASHDDRILLLRAWIELSCYLAVFIQRNSKSRNSYYNLSSKLPTKTWIGRVKRQS